jgi:hemoglobin
MTTQYEAIGGEDGVRRILRALYAKLFEDRVVGFLFQGRDQERIVEAQVPLTCAFLGGPHRYTGTPLPQAHASLPLLPGHFDRRHFLLGQVLAEAHVPDDVRSVWLRIDQGLRTSILASGEEARAKTQTPSRP